MVDKLPVIIDDRSGNMVLQALQKLLPKPSKNGRCTGVFGLGSPLLLEGYSPI
jgi:hypothetical protein